MTSSQPFSLSCRVAVVGVDVNAADNIGRTALMWAVEGGQHGEGDWCCVHGF